MRIGIDCRMYSTQFTGIGRYVYELTSNLFKIDQENEYVLFFNEPEYSLFNLPNERVKKILVNSPHYSIAEQTKFLSALNGQDLDLMHFTHFNAPLFYKRPAVVTIHDLTLSFYPGKKMNFFLYRWAYHLTLSSAVKKAKKVIAVSRNTKKDIVNILATDPQKIEVIYEGVNPAFHQFIPVLGKIEKERTKSKFNISGEYLLYTGVWRAHKNLPNLIRAFRTLKKYYGWDGKLVITGREDPLYAGEIKNLIKDNDLTNSVILTGMVSEKDLVSLYNSAAGYVFPSLYEGFGLPPLEAMQCGIPVAASNTSSIPEICGGDDNALFFNPENPNDMAEKLAKLVTDKNVRTALRKNGLEHVKNFSWQKMAEQTLRVYEDAWR